jgi:hypothetical protein
MILRSFLQLAARASLIALATASVAVGCSRQGEGERCDLVAAGSDDCDSGLTCISCGNLADHVTDRCCPAPGASSDPRCQRSPNEDATLCPVKGGTGGTGGSAGASSAGAAGMSSGGAPAGGASGSSGASSGGTAGEDDPAGAGGA